MVTFLNFYALNKYPGHFAYSVIHWMVLSLITDFLLVRRVVRFEPVPPASIWIPLVLIGLVEVSTVFQYRYSWQPYYFPASFKPYMKRIHQQPGEAILDWPFCVVGGNGVGGANGLCPLYTTTSMLYTYKRFHGKKTVGQYFGRLHDAQIQPFLQAGWPQLLGHAEVPDFMIAKHLMACFTSTQWHFFDRFYASTCYQKPA